MQHLHDEIKKLEGQLEKIKDVILEQNEAINSANDNELLNKIIASDTLDREMKNLLVLLNSKNETDNKVLRTNTFRSFIEIIDAAGKVVSTQNQIIHHLNEQKNIKSKNSKREVVTKFAIDNKLLLIIASLGLTSLILGLFYPTEMGEFLGTIFKSSGKLK